MIDTREEDAGPQRSRAKVLTVNGIFQRVERGKQEQVRSWLLERHPHLRDLMGKETAEIFSVRIETLQLLEGATDSYFERMD